MSLNSFFSYYLYTMYSMKDIKTWHFLQRRNIETRKQTEKQIFSGVSHLNLNTLI